MIAVVCMKWGTSFGADYVNTLYRAVTRQLSHPFRFYCFTDDSHGLEDGILARPLPALSLPPERIKHGCWPKIGLFQPGLIEEATALFLDLDVAIVDSLDPFVDRQIELGGLHIIREWNPGLWNLVPLVARPDRGGQSSVVCWSPREQSRIYEALATDPDASFASADNDQKHITRTAVNRHYWPARWTTSFKRSFLRYYPLDLVFTRVTEPLGTHIVVFHGKPRPHELVIEGSGRWGTKRRRGFGPVPWMQRYWNAGLGPNLGQGTRRQAVPLDRIEPVLAS